MKIESISASGIKTFEVCPHKFYYEYVLKRKQTPHPASAFGSALHLMFENACNAVIQNQSQELKDPLYHYEASIKKHNVISQYHKILKELTQKCIDWGYMNLENAKGFEIRAEFKLPCGIPVHGYIDRLDIDKDFRADIIDLKTQKDMFKQEELKDNWQAIIYYLATLNDNPLIQGDLKVSFWVLRHKIQQVVLAQNSFEQLFDKLNAKTEEIIKHDGEECIPSGLCQFCVADDCIHKKSKSPFAPKDLSQSVRDMKDFLSKLKANKPQPKPESLDLLD